MGSLTPEKLPLIKFSQKNLNPATNSWYLTCNDIRKALEEYGFFVAMYDEICSEFNDIVHLALEELFDLPRETKTKHTSDKPYFIGYVSQSPVAPIHESMAIDDTTNVQGFQSFSNLMWPAGNDKFCETMNSYAKLLSNFEKMVSRMVFESYGVEKYYEDHIGSISYVLRVLKYRVPRMNEPNVGATAHSDTSFITVLHQNQVNGLEVKTKDGWVAVDFPPKSFVVMAGEALLAWSNGRVRSPLHRVIMNGKEARYSAAMFSYKKGTILIPEELVDEEHPLQFKSFNHIGLNDFYFKHRHESTSTKAYCGV